MTALIIPRSYLLFPRRVLNADITASGSASGAGPSNLQSMRPSRYWRGSTDTPYLVLDLGGAYTVTALGLGYFNGESGDTFRVRAADSEANLTASPGYDSNTLNPSGVPAWPSGSDLSGYQLIHRHFEFDTGAGGKLQWWRIDFDWSGNSAGYLRVGRLFLGEAIGTAIPVVWPVRTGSAEGVAETEDFGGEEVGRPRGGPKRGAGVVFQWADESEWDAMGEELDRNGSARDVMLVIDKDNTSALMRYTYVGRCKDAIQTEQWAYNRFSIAVNVLEAAPTLLAA